VSKSSYTKLFGLSVLHSYFKDGVCSCLKLVPTTATAALIDRYQFSIRTMSTGIDVYNSSTTNLDQYLNYIAQTIEASYFEFELHCSDQNFYLFTDLPVDWYGQMLYSSKDRQKPQSGTSIVLERHLSPSGEGDMGTVGNIKIYFSDLMELETSKQSTAFLLNYAARATFWEYIIVGNGATDLSTAYITNNAGIDFTSPEETTLPNQQNAYMFSSGMHQLTLSDVPLYSFDLTQAQANTSSLQLKPKTLFKSLPMPSLNNLIIENAEEQSRVSSRIFVYL